MEAHYLNIAFLLILNTGATLTPVETGKAVHLSTKLGPISGENLHELNGNNALSQA
jgi:hypothetical protein